jgi:hypothetical protein
VAGIDVSATGPSGSLKQLTDQDGAYAFQQLAPGTYSVEPTLPGGLEFASESTSPASVDVVSRGLHTADFALTPAGATERFLISPTGFDFGEVQVGSTSEDQLITVLNLGPGPVVMSGTGGAPGSPFSGPQNCQGNTLEEGEFCNSFLRFSPQATGEVVNNSGGSWNGQSYTYQVRGLGITSTSSERFLITPTAFDFGEVPVGVRSPRQVVTVTNLGPGPIVMDGSGGAAGVFGGVQNCQGTTLEEGESCQTWYEFTPDAAGEVTRSTSGDWNGQAFSFEFRGVGLVQP